MPIKIPVPESAYHTQDLTLGEEGYTITFSFNISDDAWYLDIQRLSGEVLYQSLKVMPNQNLTGRSAYNEKMVGGNIWCMRVIGDLSPIARDNLGIGEVYELWWITTEEAIEGEIYGAIQL